MSDNTRGPVKAAREDKEVRDGMMRQICRALAAHALLVANPHMSSLLHGDGMDGMKRRISGQDEALEHMAGYIFNFAMIEPEPPKAEDAPTAWSGANSSKP